MWSLDGERAPRASGLCRLQPADRVGNDGAVEPFQVQRLLGIPFNECFHSSEYALGDQDLIARGFAAQPRSQIGDGPDCAVVPARLESDGADRSIALRDADAEAQLIAALLPVIGHPSNAFPDR